MATEGTQQSKRKERKVCVLWENGAESGDENHEEREIYSTGLSRSKFAGEFSLVAVRVLRGAWWWVMVIGMNLYGGTVSLGGWRYWGERVGSVGGLSSCRPEYGATTC